MELIDIIYNALLYITVLFLAVLVISYLLSRQNRRVFVQNKVTQMPYRAPQREQRKYRYNYVNAEKYAPPLNSKRDEFSSLKNAEAYSYARREKINKQTKYPSSSDRDRSERSSDKYGSSSEKYYRSSEHDRTNRNSRFQVMTILAPVQERSREFVFEPQAVKFYSMDYSKSY